MRSLLQRPATLFAILATILFIGQIHTAGSFQTAALPSYPSAGQDAIFNWQNIASGLHDVIANRQDEVVFTVPQGKALILQHIWIDNNWSVDTVAKIQRVNGPRQVIANLHENGHFMQWRGFGLRLEPGDQIMINAHENAWLGWSGFYIAP